MKFDICLCIKSKFQLLLPLMASICLALNALAAHAGSVQLYDSPADPLVGEEAIHLQKGFKLIERQYPEAASREFDSCRSNFSKLSNTALKMIGDNYASSDKFSNAINAVNITIERSVKKTKPVTTKELAAAYETRSHCYLLTDHWDEAVADCLHVIKLDQTRTVPMLANASRARGSQKRFDEALMYLDQIKVYEEQHGRPVDVWNNHDKVIMLQHAGRWSDSAKVCSETLKWIQQQPTPLREQHYQQLIGYLYAERAVCYEKLGKKELAEKDKKISAGLSHGLESDLLGPDIENSHKTGSPAAAPAAASAAAAQK